MASFIDEDADFDANPDFPNDYDSDYHDKTEPKPRCVNKKKGKGLAAKMTISQGGPNSIVHKRTRIKKEYHGDPSSGVRDDYTDIEADQVSSDSSSDEYKGYSGDEKSKGKIGKSGLSRKKRDPRPKLLKWSDNDWKQACLGIVHACGEARIHIPFAEAAKVVSEHCTAGALQQALLKLRGKQIAEGYRVPPMKMSWTKKDIPGSVVTETSRAASMARESENEKVVYKYRNEPRKPTSDAETQSRIHKIPLALPVEYLRSTIPEPTRQSSDGSVVYMPSETASHAFFTSGNYAERGDRLVSFNNPSFDPHRIANPGPSDYESSPEHHEIKSIGGISPILGDVSSLQGDDGHISLSDDIAAVGSHFHDAMCGYDHAGSGQDNSFTEFDQQTPSSCVETPLVADPTQVDMSTMPGTASSMRETATPYQSVPHSTTEMDHDSSMSGFFDDVHSSIQGLPSNFSQNARSGPNFNEDHPIDNNELNEYSQSSTSGSQGTGLTSFGYPYNLPNAECFSHESNMYKQNNMNGLPLFAMNSDEHAFLTQKNNRSHRDTIGGNVRSAHRNGGQTGYTAYRQPHRATSGITRSPIHHQRPAQPPGTNSFRMVRQALTDGTYIDYPVGPGAPCPTKLELDRTMHGMLNVPLIHSPTNGGLRTPVSSTTTPPTPRSQSFSSTQGSQHPHENDMFPGLSPTNLTFFPR